MEITIGEKALAVDSLRSSVAAEWQTTNSDGSSAVREQRQRQVSPFLLELGVEEQGQRPFSSYAIRLYLSREELPG